MIPKNRYRALNTLDRDNGVLSHRALPPDQHRRNGSPFVPAAGAANPYQRISLRRLDLVPSVRLPRERIIVRIELAGSRERGSIRLSIVVEGCCQSEFRQPDALSAGKLQHERSEVLGGQVLRRDRSLFRCASCARATLREVFGRRTGLRPGPGRGSRRARVLGAEAGTAHGDSLRLGSPAMFPGERTLILISYSIRVSAARPASRALRPTTRSATGRAPARALSAASRCCWTSTLGRNGPRTRPQASSRLCPSAWPSATKRGGWRGRLDASMRGWNVERMDASPPLRDACGMLRATDIYGGRDPEDVPAYSTRESAALVGVPVSTLRSWVLGRSFPGRGGPRTSKAMVQLPRGTSSFLSFTNLVEVHVLAAMRREHELALDAIRRATQYVHDQLEVEHPLATEKFKTNGIDLFVERLGKLINVSKDGQLGMKVVLVGSLERIEYNARGKAVRLFPLLRRRGAPKSIVIDPRCAFGRPVIAGTAVPVADVRSRFDAGDSVEVLARDFDLRADLIEDALRATPQAA